MGNKLIIQRNFLIFVSAILLIASIFEFFYFKSYSEEQYEEGYQYGYQIGHKDGVSDTKSNYSKGNQSGVTVYVTKSGSKYHEKGCSYLGDDSIPISVKDAYESGYTPCSKCNPPKYSGEEHVPSLKGTWW